MFVSGNFGASISVVCLVFVHSYRPLFLKMAFFNNGETCFLQKMSLEEGKKSKISVFETTEHYEN